MRSFNGSKVEGSLPGSFPLLNKNTHIWSIFVIRLMGQIFCRLISQRYLLLHLFIAHIVNLSADVIFIMLSPCHAERTDLLYHSQLPHWKQEMQKVKQHPFHFMDYYPGCFQGKNLNLGAVFVTYINHISLISFEMKQEYKNIPVSRTITALLKPCIYLNSLVLGHTHCVQDRLLIFAIGVSILRIMSQLTQ